MSQPRCANCGRRTKVTAGQVLRTKSLKLPGVLTHSPLRGTTTLCKAQKQGREAQRRVAA